VRRLTRRTLVSTFGPDRAMPAKTLSATVALATLAAVQACEICHLHYYHKVRETRHVGICRVGGAFIRFFPSHARRSADLALPSAFRSTQDVASATAMTSNSYCKEYQSQACCTADTALAYVSRTNAALLIFPTRNRLTMGPS
jgi:hypothetical protein